MLKSTFRYTDIYHSYYYLWKHSFHYLNIFANDKLLFAETCSFAL